MDFTLEDLKYLIALFDLPTEVIDEGLEDLSYVIESDIQLNIGRSMMLLALTLRDGKTEEENEKPSKAELKGMYPNKTKLKKLNESDTVALGIKLGIEGMDVALKSTENDEIIISWFEENIWN